MTRLLTRTLVVELLLAAATVVAVVTAADAGEIRGRVLVDGKASAGVTVSALPFEDGFASAGREARREGEPKPLATAATRPDGTFAVAMPASAGPAGTPVRLVLSGAGTPPVVLQRLLDAGGEDVGDVRLVPLAALAGRVQDERGGPVVGATVTLWAGSGGRRGDDASPVEPVPQTATTKADGTFRIEAAAAEGNRLRVEAAGFATRERSLVRSGALLKPVILALGRVLRGGVTLPDKRTPAGGALVRFDGRTTTRWLETRPDGSFLIEGVPAESGAIVADGGDRGRASVPIAAGASVPVAIVLAPTAGLRGRVVEAETARPLAGVRLVARVEGSAAFLTRSALDGHYEIRGLPPQRYRLEADDARFVPWSRRLTVVAGQAEAQDVPLVRGATLVGRVVGENGVPVEGAVVSLVRAGESPFRVFMRRMESDGGSVRTAHDGTFRADRLAPGANQRLDVRHPDFEERSLGGIDLVAGATRSGLTVTLRRGLTVRGIVKDEEGRPLAGVEVTFEQERTFRARGGQFAMNIVGPGSRPRSETGADGRFELRGLKAGNYTLAASRRGLSRVTIDPVKVAEGPAAEPIEITLRPGTTVSGLLRDRSGNGAAGWSVFARPSGEGGPGLGPGALRTEEPSGPDGAFVVEGLTEGASYDLQAMGPPGLGPRRAGVTAPADGVELTVTGQGQIRGQVLDAESSKPVQDFELRYEPDATGGMTMVFRAGPGRGRGPYEPQSFHVEDGTFVLEEVPAGKWKVEARSTGYQKGSASGVTVDEGGTAEGVDVRLSKGGVIGGRVLESSTGRPILDATVRVERSGGGSGPMIRMGDDSAENEATTDAEGRYEIAGLAPGSWTVTASHPAWSEATAGVELKDAPATQDLRLGRGGSVGGVVLAGGRPVAGAQVGLSPAGEAGFGGRGFPGAGGDQGALSDEAGRFRFDRLTPGRYTLSATLRSQSSAPVEAVVTGDGAHDVSLTLAEGALVRGMVSGLPDAARSGVNVTANGPDQFFATTRTGTDGTFELAGVPEGTIQLNANAGDFATGSRSASASVTIAPGQAEATAEIVFEQGFRVEGHVTRGGRPVADAMVMAFPAGSGRRSASARTDETGAFALEGLQEGAYTITASPQAGAPIRREVTLSGDATVELEAPPARLAGTVVEAGSGKPLGDVAVEIADDGGGVRFVTRTDTDSSGRFTFEDLEPTSYRLSFQKAAYQAETRQATPGDGSDLRVELRRGEGIGLLARDGVYATPLRGLMVRVIDGQGAAVFTGSVPLDSDGRGEVPALRPGAYELRADSSGYAPVVQPATVPSADLTLLLTPGGTLEIQAGPQTLALAQPAGRLVGADGRVYLPFIFSTDGKIRIGGPVRRIENVTPGSYAFEVEGGARREVTITEGGTSVVALP